MNLDYRTIRGYVSKCHDTGRISDKDYEELVGILGGLVVAAYGCSIDVVVDLADTVTGDGPGFSDDVIFAKIRRQAAFGMQARLLELYPELEKELGGLNKGNFRS